MKNRTLAALLGIAATATAITLGANPASAGTFNVTFDIDTSPTKTPVIAQFVTEDTLSTVSGFTGYLVTSITGFQGADPITGLVSVDPITGLGTVNLSGTFNDNLFNPNGFGPNLNKFSPGGVAYIEGGQAYQLFTDAGGQDLGCFPGCGTPPNGPFTVSNFQIVPEPTSTLSFLALGTLGAGATLKRKLKPSKSIAKETTKVG